MSSNNTMLAAIKQVCQEKNLSTEAVIGAIEAALAAAYRKEYGTPNQNIKVVFNADNGQTAVFDVKTVVENVDLEEQEKQLEEMHARKEAGEEISEEEMIKKFNPRAEIMIAEAQTINSDYKIGDVIETKLPVPEEYGRMAAQTAKQVIIQRLREAERDHIFSEYKDKEGQLTIGTIQRREGRRFIVDLGQATGVLAPEEQIRSEGYNIGTRLNFYISAVRMGSKGPEIILSRTHPEIVKELFATEVPEIAAGTVEIKSIAREAGARTKIAVFTADENIDPIGSCVGQRGARVQTVISELGGEKIDIIHWNSDPKTFIANSLSPASIGKIEVDEESKTAKVMVNDDQLSLAIGRGGQNARLAAKLTGWKIDIISPSNPDKNPSNHAPLSTADKAEEVEETQEESAEETDEVSAKGGPASGGEETKVKKEKKPAKSKKTK